MTIECTYIKIALIHMLKDIQYLAIIFSLALFLTWNMSHISDTMDVYISIESLLSEKKINGHVISKHNNFSPFFAEK